MGANGGTGKLQRKEQYKGSYKGKGGMAEDDDDESDNEDEEEEAGDY